MGVDPRLPHCLHGLARQRSLTGWRNFPDRRRSMAALLVGLVLIGAATLAVRPASAATSAAASQAATPEEVVRAWVAAVNRADAEAAIALYADDAVIEAPGQQFRGKPVIARRQRTIIAAVLRPRVEIEGLRVEAESVVVRLVGENAITRFDGRGSVHATTTFVVRDGLIRREVGPALDPPDAAWYADALPRFRATGALPPLLPNTGQVAPTIGPAGVVTGIIGVTLLVAGIALVRRRQQAGSGPAGASSRTR